MNASAPTPPPGTPPPGADSPVAASARQDRGRHRAPSGWALAVTWIGVTGIVVCGFLALWVYQSVRRAPAELAAAGRRAIGELTEVAAAFRTGTVTTRFVSQATEVAGAQYLQFATLTQTETFERTDEATVLWGNLELPPVIVEATAPVEYTYYLDFNEPWELRQAGDEIEVIAPDIRFNTPAVHASAIRYRVLADSLLRDEATAIARLKAGITAMAHQRARQNRDLVREIGRRRTEEFVESWLVNNFSDAGRYRARVRFADETETAGDPVRLPPGERDSERAGNPDER